MKEVIIATINNPFAWMYVILTVSVVYTAVTARRFQKFWEETYVG